MEGGEKKTKKKKRWTMTWKRSEAEANIWGLLRFGEQILCSCKLRIPEMIEPLLKTTQPNILQIVSQSALKFVSS